MLLVKFLVISFTSDWLYPTYQSRELVQALKRNGCDVSFCEIQADCGHDAFLLPDKRLTTLISGFLDGVKTSMTEENIDNAMRFDLQVISSWIEPREPSA